ncbi:hypothetical protein G6F50_014024 [Rhizopus delemar]|uniref:Uncharacterized protein n=1 Tax=Rhizopus delemar TaxID=936053 RepID=A0A9P6YAS3_9FUNG|nr:hypothetical protein G6F50_014024 [Rhizopus delemar]
MPGGRQYRTGSARSQQPAQRGFEGVAVEHRIGQWRARRRRCQRVDPAYRADDLRIAAVVGRVGQDPAHHVAAVGMGDHHQLGDAAAVDEAGQLVGQAAGGLRLPHVLGEIAVDDHVVAAVGQALAHGVDDRRLPVVLGGIGLCAGAMHEGHAMDIGGLGGGAGQAQQQGQGGTSCCGAAHRISPSSADPPGPAGGRCWLRMRVKVRALRPATMPGLAV